MGVINKVHYEAELCGSHTFYFIFLYLRICAQQIKGKLLCLKQREKTRGPLQWLTSFSSFPVCLLVPLNTSKLRRG